MTANMVWTLHFLSFKLIPFLFLDSFNVFFFMLVLLYGYVLLFFQVSGEIVSHKGYWVDFDVINFLSLLFWVVLFLLFKGCDL